MNTSITTMDFPPSPEMSTAAVSRDRSQRLQSAKQKLKSYRAKQAQMERAKRQSNASTSTITSPPHHVQGRSSMTSSSSLQSLQDAARRSSIQSPACHAALVGSVVSEAAAESNAQLTSQDSGFGDSTPNKRHSRGISRSGSGMHARGHSRTGSISLTQMMLGQQMAQKVQQVVSPPATAVPVVRTPSKFIASTPHSHVRGHSRSGSRSLAAASGSRSRPSSFIAPKNIELQANSTDNSFEARNWHDDEEPASGSLLPSTFRTPNTDHFAFDTSNLQTPQSVADTSASAGLTPPVPSPGLIRSPSGGFPASPSTPNAAAGSSTANHSRRPSRHARKGSVSTRRESMEIMGGLGSLGLNTPGEAAQPRHSRRISSQRWSGLQPASVLFGDDFGNTPGSASRRTSADWRASFFAMAPDYEEGDFMSALDKLEGRVGPSSSKRHSKQTSVQLPSFDDVHGESGMDKRASLHLIEANEKTTSSNSSANDIGSTSFDRLTAARGMNANPPSTSMTSPMVAELQTSIDSSGGEGLGTLMEEEEEEEDSIGSPARGKNLSIDMTTDEERKRRKELEIEVMKRTRLSGLQPKPLKLKSRPTSMYGARGMSSLSAMQSAAQDADVSENGSFEGDSMTPRAFRNLVINAEAPSPSADWSADEMQRKLMDLQATGSLDENETAAALSSARDKKKAWRSSMPSGAMSPRKSSLALTPGPAEPRSGMRTLRLASSSSLNSISPSSSVNSGLQLLNAGQDSAEEEAKTRATNDVTPRRSSLSYNTSTASDANRLSTDGHARSRSRSLRSSMAFSGSADMTPSVSQSSALSSPHTSVRMDRAPSRHLLEELTELKAQHAKDMLALDEARIALKAAEEAKRLEIAGITADLEEQERKREEENKRFAQRLEALENNLAEAKKSQEAQEADFKVQLNVASEKEGAMQTQMEDVESERDMLRDDIDGWRQRCSDLERLLRTEKSAGDELRRVRTASKSRIRELLGLLDAKNIHIAHKSIDDIIDFAEGTHSGDLVSALRSPALGPQLSVPARETCNSPASDADAPPPPQTIKLLKDMRQQIFNLAGSLEHERKQHLLARQEADELKAANERLQSEGSRRLTDVVDSSMPAMDNIDIAEDAEGARAEAAMPKSSSIPNLTMDTTEPVSVNDASQLFLGSPNSQAESSTTSMHSPSAHEMGSHRGFHTANVSSTSAMKRRKHVFAYDSSMESAMGSFSAGNSASTHQTSDYLADSGRGSMDEARHSILEEKIHIPAGSTTGKSGVEASSPETHGLGLSPLDTLDEEEEAAAESAGTQSQSRTIEATLAPESCRQSFELEAGSHSDAGSAVPPTPALEKSTVRADTLQPSVGEADRQGKSDGASSSASSSQASTDVPITPYHIAPLPTPPQSSVPAVEDAQVTHEHSVAESADDEEEEDVPVIRTPSRPEFIREWSFERASAAAKAGAPRPKLRVGTANLTRPGMTRAHTTGSKPMRRRKNGSIDDFFGIMNLDDAHSLPPLPTPDEALDMPPLVYTDQYNPVVQSGQFYGSLNQGNAPRLPSIRPPVAKTSRMYGRASLSDRSSSGSSHNSSWSQRGPSPVFNSSRAADMQRAATMPSRVQNAQHSYHQDINASGSGSGMFGRVFSMTSGALSGLGGYLYGPAPASPGLPRTNLPRQSVGMDAHLDSRSGANWAVSRHEEEIA